MKCTFIVQYNGYCLKWKKWKKKKSAGGLSFLSQVFNDIEDN